MHLHLRYSLDLSLLRAEFRLELEKKNVINELSLSLSRWNYAISGTEALVARWSPHQQLVLLQRLVVVQHALQPRLLRVQLDARRRRRLLGRARAGREPPAFRVQRRSEHVITLQGYQHMKTRSHATYADRTSHAHLYYQSYILIIPSRLPKHSSTTLRGIEFK